MYLHTCVLIKIKKRKEKKISIIYAIKSIFIYYLFLIKRKKFYSKNCVKKNLDKTIKLYIEISLRLIECFLEIQK